MKKNIFSFILLSFLVITPPAHAQQKIFHKVISHSETNYGPITGITQDRQGYIWFSSYFMGSELHRYDGSSVTSYLHNPQDTVSLVNSGQMNLCVDSSGNIWIAAWERGLFRFNPATHTFTRFHHNPNNPSSVISDSIGNLITDHLGNLWIASFHGLDMFNSKTGKFVHYFHRDNDPSSLSANIVVKLYEDRDGNIWVSCFGGRSGLRGKSGLDLFNRKTGTFTLYQPDPKKPLSLYNAIFSIYEDSKATLWVGTFNDGLMALNRSTGIFTRYPYDPNHSGKPSAPPKVKNKNNLIIFIQEDAAGNLWIGNGIQGILKYNLKNGEEKHYGRLILPSGKVIADTSYGFTDSGVETAFLAKNGLLWLSDGKGDLYYVNPFRENIPYYPIKQQEANAFYKDDKGNVWIATDDGLLYRPVHEKEKLYVHDPHNSNSLAGNRICSILADKKGNLWIAREGYNKKSEETKHVGIDKYALATGTFSHYTDSGWMKGNIIHCLCFDDHQQFLWLATTMGGLYEMNTKTGEFVRHLTHQSNKDYKNELSNNIIYTVAAYNKKLWAGTIQGLDMMDERTGEWKHYLHASTILAIFQDATGTLWVGTTDGLYFYNKQRDRFHLYTDPATGLKPKNVLNILEDNYHNLWINSTHAIYRISANRDTIRIFGQQYGVHPNLMFQAFNYKAKDGELFLGDQKGYYAFYPGQLNKKAILPTLNITGFQLHNKEVKPGPKSPLHRPMSQTKIIRLDHKQNSFSIDFIALHYADPGEEHYRYMMQNYNNIWHDIGNQQNAYFFNVPPGHYIFKLRAVNSNGAWTEKDMAIVITPPWWITWWAITIFILLGIGIIWFIIYLRSRQLHHQNKMLEEKVTHRTQQLQQSLNNLKSAQKQLIQSEKMASLGELTAGIAHEIQNPLNFVNNFSEVNRELIEELRAERLKPEAERNDQQEDDLLKDIDANEEKILHHGKRADAIVKGMLQHSRGSSGERQPTDINALVDEYLRLSYHGMRAKDKSFNATIKTDFDETIGKINIVPGDIGRLLLNLYNNAFYATSLNPKEGAKDPNEQHIPTVWVSTKKEGLELIIRVRDNGPGIPNAIKDKIFQPFFTTKPTGEGTGLGLSLSYDIIKAHDGKIKVETKEGEGTEFTVTLPDNSTFGDTSFPVGRRGRSLPEGPA